MGFTDKLAGMLKKKSVIPKEVVLFEDLDSFINEKISEEEERITQEGIPVTGDILDGFEELSRFLERLKEMEREEMFKKLDMIVRTAQKRFSTSLKNVVTRIRLESKSYDGLKHFHEEVTDALQQIQKLNRMHGRSLYLAFDKEMKNFSKTAKIIAIHNNVLGDLLQSEGDIIAEFRLIHEQFTDIERMREELSDIEKEKGKTEKSVETLETEIETWEKKLRDLESSDEYQHVVTQEKRHDELETRLKSTEGEIYNILHPLDRDFRKFRRQVELGKFPFDVKLLEKYEHMTEQFLQEKEGYPLLKKIAEKMQEALQKQIIKEKGHKKEKVLDILNLILTGGLLELQKQYHAVRTQLETASFDTDVLKKIETVEKEIEEKRDKIADLKEKEEEINSKTKYLKENILEIEDKIRDKSSEIGMQVE